MRKETHIEVDQWMDKEKNNVVLMTHESWGVEDLKIMSARKDIFVMHREEVNKCFLKILQILFRSG